METKQAVRELLERLPDDCTLDDVLYHLYVLQRIAEGRADSRSGQLIPHEEVARDLRRRWLYGAG
jgi:predicted transcriptional regulator